MIGIIYLLLLLMHANSLNIFIIHFLDSRFIFVYYHVLMQYTGGCNFTPVL